MDQRLIKHELEHEEMVSHNVQLVKVELSTDYEDELQEFAELDGIEDKIDKPDIVNVTEIKQEVLESIKRETVPFKDETILISADGAAAGNRPNNAIDSTVYICGYCHENFTERRELSSHMITYHKDKGGLNDHLVNDIVNNVRNQKPLKDIITVKKEIKQPLKKIKNKKPSIKLECDKCDFKTMKKSLLTRHQRKHMSQRCKYCSKSFSRKFDMDSHVLASHKDQIADKNQAITSKIHKCKECEYETVRAGDLKRHLLKHSGINLFTCVFCSKGFNRRAYLDSHLLKKHRTEFENTEGLIEAKIHTCDLCEYEAVRYDDYKRHLAYHKGDSEACDEFRCKLCPFVGVDKRSYKRHQLVHSDVKLFTCEICDKGFNRKRSVNSHMLAHHKDEVANIDKLITHKIHECPKCPYKTMLACHLRRHLETHGESQLEGLVCEVCGFKTIDKGNLNKHMRKHSDVKRFLCSECDKGFNFKNCIDAHVLAAHRDNEELMSTITTKVYACDDCNYITIKIRDIKTHRNLHL